MAITFTKIASVELTSNASNITFSSIPNTYFNLVIFAAPKNAANGGNAGMTHEVNGVGWSRGNRYYSLTANGFYSGSSVAQISQANNSNSTNMFGNHEMYVFRYSSTQFKAMQYCLNVATNTASAGEGIHSRGSLNWDSTAQITELKFIPESATQWVAGTNFYLYGLSNTV